MDYSIPQLAARVQTLERQIRILGCTAGILALLALVAAARPPQTAELVRAQRLQLVDPDGRVRIDLRHDPGETGLFVMDEVGDVRLGAAHFAHGGTGYALHGPGGRGAAVMYLRGEGSLTIYDEDGNATDRFPD